MRRLEKDFALSGEERFGDQLNEREDEFETALAASTLATNVKTELLGLAHAYKLAFAGFLVSRQTLDDQLDDLSQIFDRTRPALVKVADAANVPCRTRAAQGRRVPAGLQLADRHRCVRADAVCDLVRPAGRGPDQPDECGDAPARRRRFRRRAARPRAQRRDRRHGARRGKLQDPGAGQGARRARRAGARKTAARPIGTRPSWRGSRKRSRRAPAMSSQPSRRHLKSSRHRPAI